MPNVYNLHTKVNAAVRTYQLSERSEHLDFNILEREVRPALSEPHRHEYYQMQFKLDGESSFHLGGMVKNWCPGTLAFILPYRIHMNPHPDGTRYILISFTQKFIRPDLQADPLDLEEVPLEAAPELAPFKYQEFLDFNFSGSELAQVQSLLQTMLRENQNRRFGSLEILRGLMLQLIGVVCRSYEAPIMRLVQSKAHKVSRREALKRVTKYIRDNLADDISLTDAAAAAFLSPNYLTHLLKQETGRTFTDTVTERRIEKARELLANTNLRIAEVATACGFTDEAYFTRRFRQKESASPRSYRENIRAALMTGQSYTKAS